MGHYMASHPTRNEAYYSCCSRLSVGRSVSRRRRLVKFNFDLCYWSISNIRYYYTCQNLCAFAGTQPATVFTTTK